MNKRRKWEKVTAVIHVLGGLGQMNGFCRSSGHLWLSRLGLAAPFRPSVASSAAPHAKAATALAASPVSPAAACTASGSKVGSVPIGTSATLLDGYLLGSDLMGVGRNGRGIAGRLSEFHKSAVLDSY